MTYSLSINQKAFYSETTTRTNPSLMFSPAGSTSTTTSQKCNQQQGSICISLPTTMNNSTNSQFKPLRTTQLKFYVESFK